MVHQVGVSFDLYYDARKHKIKICWASSQMNKDEFFRVKILSQTNLNLLQNLLLLLLLEMTEEDGPCAKE